MCTLDARSEYRIYFYKDKRSRHFNAQVSISLGLFHSFFRLCSHRLANVGAPLPPVAPPTYSSPQHSQGSGGNGRGSSHNLSSEHIYASGSANTSMAAITTDSLHNTSMPIHFSNHPKQHHTGKKKALLIIALFSEIISENLEFLASDMIGVSYIGSGFPLPSLINST